MGIFCNVRNEIYTGNKAILASVQAPTLTIIMRNLVPCRGALARTCGGAHAHTHVPWSTSGVNSVFQELHGTHGPRPSWLQSLLKAGEPLRCSSLSAPLPFFSTLHRNAESRSSKNLWKIFPEIIITQAREKAQLEGTVLSSMFRTRIKEKIKPSVIGAFL